MNAINVSSNITWNSKRVDLPPKLNSQKHLLQGEPEMKNLTIIIDNPNDKLTQQEWSQLYFDVDTCVNYHLKTVHFRAASKGNYPYQNAVWVGEITKSSLNAIRKDLLFIRQQYELNTISLTVGEPELL